MQIDEYLPEAVAIGETLHTVRSEERMHHLVYQVFCRHFGEDSVGSVDRYRRLASRLWKIKRRKY